MARDVNVITDELIASQTTNVTPIPLAGDGTVPATYPSQPSTAQPNAIAPLAAEADPVTEVVSDAPTEDMFPENAQIASASKFIKDAIAASKKIGGKIVEAGETAAKKQGMTADLPNVSKTEGGFLVRSSTEAELQAWQNALPSYNGKSLNFVRLDQYMGTDAAGAFAKFKEANPELIESARRGTIKMSELQAMADNIGLGDIIQNFAMRNPGAPLPLAEDTLAAVGLMTNIFADMQTLSAKATASKTPEDSRKLLEVFTLARELTTGVSGVTSEYARGIGAIGNLAQKTGIDPSKAAAEMELVMRRFEATQDINIFGEFFGKLETNGQRTAFVRGEWWDKLKSGTGNTYDIIVEGYINGLLSSPVTHATNIIGNSAFGLWNIGERYVASGVGYIRTFGGLTGAERVTVSEANAYAYGAVESFTDALRVSAGSFVKDAPISGTTKAELFRTKALSAETLGAKPNSPFGKAIDLLGTYNRLPGRLMMAEDEFFKAMGYRMELRAQAQREADRVYFNALENGATKDVAQTQMQITFSDFLANPPKKLLDTADEAAKTLTFQKDLPDFLSTAESFANNPLMKFYIPFFRTPANITIETLKRTPLNPDSYVELGKALMNKGTPESDLAIAKFAMGSAAMGTFGYIAYGADKPGFFITGSPPKDIEARQRDENLGIVPYAFVRRLPDGRYESISYQKFDPISGLLALSADYAKFAKEANWEKENLDLIKEAAMVGALAVTKYLGEQSSVQGMADFAKLFTQYKTDDDWDAFSKGVETLSRGVTGAVIGAVPGFGSFSAAAERVIDPRASQTTIPTNITEDGASRGFDTAIARAKSRMPGLSENVAESLNLWGETRTQGQGSWLEIVNPIRVYTGKFSPVDEEMRRIDMAIAMPKRDMGIGVPLTAQQYNDWILMTNTMDFSGKFPGDPGYKSDQAMLPVIQKEIASKSYQSASVDRQEDTIRYIYNSKQNAAKKLLQVELYRNNPDFRARLEADNPDLAAKVGAR